MFLTWSLIGILIVISILRGSDNDSPIGIKKCDTMYWALLGILSAICILYEIIAIYVVRNEYEHKVKCGYQFSPGDFKATNSDMLILVAFTFFGSFSAAFCGSGPGNIFVGLLIQRGIDMKVAYGTGTYMAMMTTFSASLQMIFYKKIRLDYGAYIELMAIAGTLPGIFF